MEHAPDADPPRRVAGGASLGRARPLASLVALGGTTASGSMPNGSFLRRRHRLAPMRGQSTSENRAPTSRRGLGVAKHGRDAFHRVVTNRAHAPLAKRRQRVRPHQLRLSHPFATPPPLPRIASQRLTGPPLGEHATRHLRVGAFVTRSAGGPLTPCDALRIDEPEMRTTDVCPIPRMDTGTLIRSVIAPVRGDADDVSRRRCALRCCGSRLARRVRPASAKDRAPLAFPSSTVGCAIR